MNLVLPVADVVGRENNKHKKLVIVPERVKNISI